MARDIDLTITENTETITLIVNDCVSGALFTTEFVADTTYTLSDTDTGKQLIFTNAGGCVVTYPSVLLADFNCMLASATTGVVEVQGAGVINMYGEYKLAGQYATASLVPNGVNSARLVGETKK